MAQTSTIPQMITRNQSLVLVKNMFRLTVSSICYLRGIFPSECFSSRDYAGVQVHQLECAEKDKDGKIIVKYRDAFLLTQWLECGVFDALEKSYLKSLTFAVYSTPNLSTDDSNDTLIETYQFTVEYSDAQVKLNGLAMNRDNLKKQAVTFIRCLIEFTSTLDELPENRYLTLKIQYYDDTTPWDYEPKYFTSAPPDILKFSSKPSKLKIGKLNTPYHKLQLKFAGVDSLMQDPVCQMHSIYNEPISKKEDKEVSGSKECAASNESNISDNDLVKSPKSPPRPVNESEDAETVSALDKLSHSMSNLMDGQVKKDVENVRESSPILTVYDRVKKYMTSTGKATVRNCASDLAINASEVRAIFNTLVKEGTLKYTKRFFEHTPLPTPYTAVSPTPPQNSLNESTMECSDQSIFTSSPGKPHKLRHQNPTENKIGTVEEKSVSKLSPRKLEFKEAHKRAKPPESVSDNDTSCGDNKQPPLKIQKSSHTEEHWYISQDSGPTSKSKCSIIKDPLYQVSKQN